MNILPQALTTSDDQSDLIAAFIQDIQLPGHLIQAGTVDRVDWILTPESLFLYLNKNADKNIYFVGGVDPTRGKERARDEDIRIKNYVYFDFDLRKAHPDMEDFEIKELAEYFREVLKQDPELSQWRYINFSGNGLHLYYVGDPVVIQSPEHWKLGMLHYVERLENLTGEKVDRACINVSRLARLPGSYNCKAEPKRLVKILSSQKCKAHMLERLEIIGAESIQHMKEEAQERAKQMTIEHQNSDSTYATIQALPIAPLVCTVMGWETNGRNFWKPGETKHKACFVPKGENFIVHNGTDHFEPIQRGFSPFEFVKAKLELDNAATFAWFKQQLQVTKDVIRKSSDIILDSRFPIYTNRDNPEIKRPAFALQSVGDFLAEPEEALDWVVDELLPVGGFSLVAAKPKVGKSTEARNLLRCVARGEPYLGRSTTQGTVLYVAFEEKRGEVRKQFAQMGLKSEDPILLYIGSAPTAGLEALSNAIVENHPILIVVDPLFLLLPVKDVNDYAELTKRLDPLRSLARENGCHILVTHHLSKMGGGGGDGVLGSTAIFGTVDTLIQMRKREDGSRIIHSIQRYGTDLPETVLMLDKESGQTNPLGELEKLQGKDAEQSVLDILCDEEMEEKDIRERAGGNQRVIAGAIRSLVASGRIRREGEGKRGSPYRYRCSHETLEMLNEREGISPAIAMNEGKVSENIKEKPSTDSLPF